MVILHLAMVGLFLLDLALPRNVPLLDFYFLLVVLSASFAVPRQMVPLIVQAYGLAIASGLYWRFFPSLDFITRLLALSAVAAVAVWLSAQRSRQTALRRRSEQILNITFENAAAGVGLADASGRLIRVNPALCALLGRDEETLLGQSWSEISHPDDVAKEQPLVEEMLANRRDSCRLQKRYWRGDGSTVWVDLSLSCGRSPDGRLEFFIGQAIDISREVESQQALARSEEMLRRTLEQCSVGLALCAPGTGAILLANSELASELALSSAALKGSSLPQVLGALERLSAEDADADSAMDLAALEALLRGERDHYSVRVRLQRPGRQRSCGKLLLSNLRDASGAVVQVLLELDDISDVVAQTEYLQAAAAAGVVGIWDWDPVHDVLTWDPVMYRLYGCQPEQFSGAYQAWSQSLHPDDRPGIEAKLQAALRGEGDYGGRFRVIWPDGSVHYLQAVSRISFDGHGRPLRMLGVNYDITDLVNTQEQLAAEQERLRAILDSLLDPHLVFSPVRDDTGSIVDLRILRCNPAAAVYNHTSIEMFVGATLRQVLPQAVEGGLFKGLFELYRQALISGEPVVVDNFEVPDHELLGSTRYYDIRAVKVGEELSVTWRDVTERIVMEQALRQRAATDSLTSLLNREEVFRQIEWLMGSDRRQGGDLAVLFCDLDRFKEVNDTYGHAAGDAVLQAMAQRIRSCLRATDLAARVGGDELLVVLPGVHGLEGALAIAQKLRELAREPVPIPQGDAQITVSVGVALASPGEALDALIARADTAMYAAKQRGRDQVVAISAAS